MKRYGLLIVLVVVLMLAACGGDDDDKPAPTPTPFPTLAPTVVPDSGPPPDDLETYGLEAGQGALTVAGFFEGDEQAREPRYYPSGMLGATNYSGLREVALAVRGTATESGESSVMEITLVLEEGVTSGEHEISDNFDADSTRGRVSMRGFSSRLGNFNDVLSGTAVLDYVGFDSVTGSFEATLAHKDGHEVAVTGSFYAIPYTLQSECMLQVSGFVQAPPEIGDANAGSDGTTIRVQCGFRYSPLVAGSSLIEVDGTFELAIEVGAEAGTYDVAPDSAPVEVNFLGLDVKRRNKDGDRDDLEELAHTGHTGTVTVNYEEDGTLYGDFDVTFETAEGNLQFTGQFRFQEGG